MDYKPSNLAVQQSEGLVRLQETGLQEPKLNQDG